MGLHSTDTSSRRRGFVKALVPLYLSAIGGIPTLCAIVPVMYAPAIWLQTLAILMAPAVFAVAYALTAGLLSMPTRYAIMSGTFPRDLGHRIYGPRRLYALCWTAVYYFTPLYHAVLAIPTLKKVVFRLFGYSGSLDTTFYPDTWLRDLPILEVREGAYIANRATLGSNICLQNGQILVEKIYVGERVMIGHLAVIGLGDVIEDDAEVGVGSTLGMRVHVGARTRIGARCGLNHGARIGADCTIESTVQIGIKAVVRDGIRLRFGTVVPDRTVISSQQQADLLAPDRLSVSSATIILPALDSPALEHLG